MRWRHDPVLHGFKTEGVKCVDGSCSVCCPCSSSGGRAVWPTWTEDGGAESSGSVSQSAVGRSHKSEAMLDRSSAGTRERGHIGDAVKKTPASSAPLPRRVLECETQPSASGSENLHEKFEECTEGVFTRAGWVALLDDVDTFKLLFDAVSSLAQATVPPEIAAALTRARLTALSKPDGGVRGIATGCSLSRLVVRTLAKQFATEFEQECAPFQYAFSTRAGTDFVGHMLRAATDRDGSATILSVDGTGAYDHVLRAAMLERLEQMPGARSILPFVRLSYATPSKYSWWDDDGQKRTVTQAEGGEQGDPLMPLLFSIGIQGALEGVSAVLQPGRGVGIRLHQGKTRVWDKRWRAT